MSQMQLPVDQIRPNPYQTRLADDVEHVQSIADSIREVGLLQVPLARFAADDVAELAFGHSRLAAWRIAKPGEPFPVEIRQLSDRQMSDLAAEENSRRKNLSAIETARAIQRRMDDFGLTQLEAGKPFGYSSQGAVSNVLRLLKLPEPVQVHVASGELPERLARQLVNLGTAAPKEAARIAKNVAKAAAGEREEVLREGLFDLTNEHGQDLSGAPFDMDWPAQPIPVDHLGGAPLPDGLDALRACNSCPYLFRYEMARTCTLPACFALKQSLAIDEQIAAATKRLGVYKADPSRAVTPVLEEQVRGLGWDTASHVRKLVKANQNTELGLCLVAYPPGRHWLKEVTGSIFVAVATTNLAAVQAYFKSGSPTVIVPTTLEAKVKAAAKAREQEEAAREERRAERAANLRYEHDVVWLIKHAAEWIGDQLTISGGVLTYVQDKLEPDAQYGDIQTLRDYEAELDDLIRNAKSDKEAEPHRRRHLALTCMLSVAFGYQLQRGAELWESVTAEVKEVATGISRHGKQETLFCLGFGVKLPPGWDKPPIHRTDYNCWTCGKFAGGRKLTKRDQEEGWVIATQGDKTVSVQCPEHSKPLQALMPAKPAPKANGKAKSNGKAPARAPGTSTGKLSKAAKLKQKTKA